MTPPPPPPFLTTLSVAPCFTPEDSATLCPFSTSKKRKIAAAEMLPAPTHTRSPYDAASLLQSLRESRSAPEKPVREVFSPSLRADSTPDVTACSSYVAVIPSSPRLPVFLDDLNSPPAFSGEPLAEGTCHDASGQRPLVQGEALALMIADVTLLESQQRCHSASVSEHRAAAAEQTRQDLSSGVVFQEASRKVLKKGGEKAEACGRVCETEEDTNLLKTLVPEELLGEGTGKEACPGGWMSLQLWQSIQATILAQQAQFSEQVAELHDLVATQRQLSVFSSGTVEAEKGADRMAEAAHESGGSNPPGAELSLFPLHQPPPTAAGTCAGPLDPVPTPEDADGDEEAAGAPECISLSSSACSTSSSGPHCPSGRGVPLALPPRKAEEKEMGMPLGVASPLSNNLSAVLHPPRTTDSRGGRKRARHTVGVPGENKAQASVPRSKKQKKKPSLLSLPRAKPASGSGKCAGGTLAVKAGVESANAGTTKLHFCSAAPLPPCPSALPFSSYCQNYLSYFAASGAASGCPSFAPPAAPLTLPSHIGMPQDSFGFSKFAAAAAAAAAAASRSSGHFSRPAFPGAPFGASALPQMPPPGVVPSQVAPPHLAPQQVVPPGPAPAPLRNPLGASYPFPMHLPQVRPTLQHPGFPSAYPALAAQPGSTRPLSIPLSRRGGQSALADLAKSSFASYSASVPAAPGSSGGGAGSDPESPAPFKQPPPLRLFHDSASRQHLVEVRRSSRAARDAVPCA